MTSCRKKWTRWRLRRDLQSAVSWSEWCPRELCGYIIGGVRLLGEILEGLNAERDRSGMTRLEWSVDLFILFIHKLHSLEMGDSGSG